jgi:hypothetical protein
LFAFYDFPAFPQFPAVRDALVFVFTGTDLASGSLSIIFLRENGIIIGFFIVSVYFTMFLLTRLLPARLGTAGKLRDFLIRERVKS